MRKADDLTGKKFGLLTVLYRAENAKANKARWVVVCECGNHNTSRATNLKNGTAKSCGCIRKTRAKYLTFKHGDSRSKEYYAWANLVRRCTDPSARGYSDYGGRGIVVFNEWIDSYDKFLGYLGRAPSGHHSIDRINTNGNYEPGNIKWSTRIEQNSNKRNNVYVDYNGEKITLSELSRRVNLKIPTLRKRIVEQKMDIRDAVKPVRFRGYHIN